MAFLDEESFALLFLFVHSSLSNFATHGPWSGIGNGSILYVPPLANFIAELFASLVAFAAFRIDCTSSKIPIEMRRNTKQTMAIAVLVVAAKCMKYVSSHYLTLVNSQIIAHFEFQTTAFFTFILLGVSFSHFRIVSAVTLILGLSVITVQLYPVGNIVHAPFLGFVLALGSSFIFGFSSIRYITRIILD